MKPPASQRGFTLIQISVLLLVASLVMVNILPSAQTKLTKDKDAATKLNAVLLSLREYQAVNGTLPCPADASLAIGAGNYGVTAANSGAGTNCTGGTPAANYTDATNHVAIGMVPVRTLGVANDYALDAYGRDITYAVDTNATSCWASSSLTGQIAVTDNGRAANTVAALVSHGYDGHGSYTPLTGTSGTAVRLNAGSTDADQLTNAHVDSSFAAISALNSFIKKAPTSTFDDLVVYRSPLWTLNNLPTGAPAVTSISPPANGTYTTGQVLSFTVNFSAAVTVTTTGGTPYLSLSAITGSIGTANLAKATYQSGSGTTALVFSYTVAGADNAPTGLTILPSIATGGGSILAGTFCPILGFTAPDLSEVIVGAQYVYATDASNNRVEVFNTSGTYQSKFGSSGSGNGQFNQPWGVAIDSTGNIWVVDESNNRVEQFNSSGSYLNKFGTSGSGNGQFSCPNAIVFDPTGNFWVVDQCNNRVEKFNSSGSYLTTAGSLGSGNGKLNSPSHVAADSSGNIWVTDQSNNRVEEFNSSGSYLNKITSATFSHLGGVAIDSGGNIWVSDESNNNVQKFNTGGTWQSQLGCISGACSSSTANGKFNNPDGLFFDSSGNVWVADTNNNRVQEFNNGGTWIRSIGGPSPYTCETSPSGSTPACASGAGNGQFNGPRGISVH